MPLPDAARTRLAEHGNNVYLRTQQLLLAYLAPLWLLIALTAEWPWRARWIVAAALLATTAASAVFSWRRLCSVIADYADHREDLVSPNRDDARRSPTRRCAA